MSSQEIHRLSDITQYMQQVVSINFEQPFWLQAEINQINHSRGNFYITLVEKHEVNDEIIAKMEGRLWRSYASIIRLKAKAEIDQVLAAGTEVKLRGVVQYHQIYGLSFDIRDIDLDFTLGALERKKRATIETLNMEGVFEWNKRQQLVGNPQRIAVISSRTAAGYADFINQLYADPQEYSFSVHLYHCAVQGSQAVQEMIESLDIIKEYQDLYDVAVILRGGGSRLDLSVFDDEALCRKISEMPLPVFTAIGHEIDTSIADMTAHTDFKTPTAVAQYIRDYVEDSFMNLQEINQTVRLRMSNTLDRYKVQLDRVMLGAESSAMKLIRQVQTTMIHLRHRIQQKVMSSIQNRKHDLHLYTSSTDQYALSHLKNMRTYLMHLTNQIEKQAMTSVHQRKHLLQLTKVQAEAIDPQQVLKRGFTIIDQADQIIKSKHELKTDQALRILFHDGVIEKK